MVIRSWVLKKGKKAGSYLKSTYVYLSPTLFYFLASPCHSYGEGKVLSRQLERASEHSKWQWTKTLLR